ncbi:MAG: hypothetical protein ACD_7C00376G0001 [uncultured bacterium]|nr:MAG: hypothetical protein ACD_7C00376G0001 [uncultured bacterium]
MSEIIFLGTGPSTGVPVIACSCKTCKSKSRYNKRLRPSILIRHNKKNILVDAGPDIRQQALKYKIKKVDALIITHSHFDHIAGIDDLRIYNRKKKKAIDCFLLKETYEELKVKYEHLFTRNLDGHTKSAKFVFHILDDQKDHFKFAGITFNYFSFFQDSKKVLGIRLNNIAYVTDIKRYDKKKLDEINNLDFLILSCLKKTFCDVHFNLKEAIDFIKKINPKMSFLTHLAHEVDYHSFLPKNLKNIKLAYDGLILRF